MLKSSFWKPKQTQWSLLAMIALASSVLISAAPIGYSLTVVAKTGDTIGGKTLTGFKQPSFGPNAPAINAGGTVAFYATYSEGAFVGEGIFTPASLLLKIGDSVGGRALEGISFVPALNDRGTVAVNGLLSSQGPATLTSTSLLAKAGTRSGGKG
jgi:hypothetical protein